MSRGTSELDERYRQLRATGRALRTRFRRGGQRYWRRIDSIRDEAAVLAEQRISGLLQSVPDRWRASCEVPVPEFRLPPDGWAKKHITEALGELYAAHVNDFELSEKLDLELRSMAERALPSAPFPPLTVTRTRSARLYESLCLQDAHNAELLSSPQVSQLQRWIHGDLPPPVSFFAPNLDLAVHAVEPTYHQVQLARSHLPAEIVANRRRLLTLRPSDLVHFRHAFSSTTKAWWFRSLGPPPQWWNSEPTTDLETGLRLELWPFRGFFVGPAVRSRVTTHLEEEELIHPPDTFWRVHAHRDVRFVNSRGAQEFGPPPRLHHIQLIEVVHPKGHSDVVEMTAVIDN